jgi:hypothetical protein
LHFRAETLHNPHGAATAGATAIRNYRHRRSAPREVVHDGDGSPIQAGEQFAGIVAGHPDDYSATLGLGRVALLSNRLDAA